MAAPVVIDTKMHGRTAITAAHLLQGEQTALVETGPKSSVHNVLGALEARRVETLDWIVVTHIHLDHAGAAGTIARRFPEAKVAVHPVGAPHLVDPSKLWSSAARIYGDRMEEMWGGIDPIPDDRIHVLKDGDVLDLGGHRLVAHDTPGHAFHHHAYLDEDTGVLFSGDALGVRLPDVGMVRPATPPPEFDLERFVASIGKIRALAPERIYLTHFGPHDGGINVRSVDDLCTEAIDALHLWGQWVREARAESDDLETMTASVTSRARETMERDLGPELIARMEDTTSYRMNTWGYKRYFDKSAPA